MKEYKMLRIDSNIHEIIVGIAKREHRTISNTVEQLTIRSNTKKPTVKHLQYKILQLTPKQQKELMKWLCMKTEQDT